MKRQRFFQALRNPSLLRSLLSTTESLFAERDDAQILQLEKEHEKKVGRIRSWASVRSLFFQRMRWQLKDWENQQDEKAA